LLKCKTCGASLDLTMAACPACGTEVPMGRLTGILGLVCRHCDAYNEPGARLCVSCGQALGSEAPAPATPAAAPPAAATRAAAPPVVSEPTPSPVAAAAIPAGPPAPPPATAPRPQPPRYSPLPRTGSPVVQSFPRPGGAVAPTVAIPAGPPPRCSSCGSELGPGPYCPSCGRPAPGVAATGAFLSPPLGAGAGAHVPQPGTAMFVAVSAPVYPRARIVVERGESPPGTVFQLGAEEVQAGRSQGAVIFPSDPCLAAHHATFVQRGGQLTVRDEGAAGGIYVRIPTGQPVALKPGGLFTAGDRLLRFAGTVPPAPPPPPDGTMRLGAPRPEGPTVLLEEWLEGGVGGRVWMRAGPSITVGRAGCSVNLGDDAYLSQAHAEIVVESDGTASLRDLGSSNGTFVRVPPGTDAPLRDGDELRMGREVLRVEVR
jgi:pSer/pThr/pTyr-binding forkhead associated (FHA) protein